MSGIGKRRLDLELGAGDECGCARGVPNRGLTHLNRRKRKAARGIMRWEWSDACESSDKGKIREIGLILARPYRPGGHGLCPACGGGGWAVLVVVAVGNSAVEAKGIKGRLDQFVRIGKA